MSTTSGLSDSLENGSNCLIKFILVSCAMQVYVYLKYLEQLYKNNLFKFVNKFETKTLKYDDFTQI